MFFERLGCHWRLTAAVFLFIGPAAALSQEASVVVGDPTQAAVEQPAIKPTPNPEFKKPRVTLTCSPQLGAVGPYGRLSVEAKVIVVGPDERLWCPDIEWLVNDEVQSSREVRCNQTFAQALEEAERGELRYSIIRWWALQGGGYLYKIRVRLKRSGKTIEFRDCDVSVR